MGESWGGGGEGGEEKEPLTIVNTLILHRLRRSITHLGIIKCITKTRMKILKDSGDFQSVLTFCNIIMRFARGLFSSLPLIFFLKFNI